MDLMHSGGARSARHVACAAAVALVLGVAAGAWAHPDLEVTKEAACTCLRVDRGGEGCTPGYWKQGHHFGNWQVYGPDDSYDAVFGVSSSFGGGFSLLDALSQGGGGEAALGRHAVAALLNAASGGVAYGFSEAEVIAIVQEAYATGDFEQAKDRLESANEADCPLGRADVFTRLGDEADGVHDGVVVCETVGTDGDDHDAAAYRTARYADGKSSDEDSRSDDGSRDHPSHDDGSSDDRSHDEKSEDAKSHDDGHSDDQKSQDDESQDDRSQDDESRDDDSKDDGSSDDESDDGFDDGRRACVAYYKITVRNVGDVSVAGAFVEDVLPAHVAFVSASPSQGSYDPLTGIWDVGGIPLGGMAMLRIDVDVDGGFENGDAKDGDAGGLCIENCAALVGLGEPDVNPANDRDCITVFTGEDDGHVDHADGAICDGTDGDYADLCEGQPDWWSRLSGRGTDLLEQAALAESPRKARRLARRAKRTVRKLARRVARAERRESVPSSCLPQLWDAVDEMKHEAKRMSVR